MLFIGSVKGGPEVRNTCVGRLITQLMQVASEERGEFALGSVSALNVVFHVPGSVLSNVGYEGLRDGIFSRRQKLLMIQVAVPHEVAATDSGTQARQFLLWALEEANRLAATYLKKKRIEYSQPKFLALVDRIRSRLLSQDTGRETL